MSNTKFQPLPIPLPFAVFDEFGKGADDRMQDYAAAAVAAERVRFADELAAEITLDGFGCACDEPMFVLMGRDPVGGALVRLWAKVRETIKPGDKKIGEAQECAALMDDWCLRTAGREVRGVLALLPFDVLAAEMVRRGATVKPAPPGGDFCSPSA